MTLGNLLSIRNWKLAPWTLGILENTSPIMLIGDNPDILLLVMFGTLL